MIKKTIRAECCFYYKSLQDNLQVHLKVFCPSCPCLQIMDICLAGFDLYISLPGHVVVLAGSVVGGEAIIVKINHTILD